MSYGYKTQLIVDGEEFELKAVSYDLHKAIDENGDIASATRGGIIYLSLENLPTNMILEWGMKHRLYKKGVIKTINIIDGTAIVDEEIEFDNAACINMKIAFERDSPVYFTTLLTISPQDMCIGRNNCWINKEWVS